MTVSELIKLLSNCPQDAQVVVWNAEVPGALNIQAVHNDRATTDALTVSIETGDKAYD